MTPPPKWWLDQRCYCGLPKAAWSDRCPQHADPGSFELFILTPVGQEWARKNRADLFLNPDGGPPDAVLRTLLEGVHGTYAFGAVFIAWLRWWRENGKPPRPPEATRRERIRATGCALYFGIVPYWVYEAQCHYAPMSYLEHLSLNIGYAWRWLTFRESPGDVEFERTENRNPTFIRRSK